MGSDYLYSVAAIVASIVTIRRELTEFLEGKDLPFFEESADEIRVQIKQLSQGVIANNSLTEKKTLSRIGRLSTNEITGEDAAQVAKLNNQIDTLNGQIGDYNKIAGKDPDREIVTAYHHLRIRAEDEIKAIAPGSVFEDPRIMALGDLLVLARETRDIIIGEKDSAGPLREVTLIDAAAHPEIAARVNGPATKFNELVRQYNLTIAPAAGVAPTDTTPAASVATVHMPS